MAIHLENVRDSLYRQTSLSDKTLQYEYGDTGEFKSHPKQIHHNLAPGLRLVIKWDYPYDHDRLGGADVTIEVGLGAVAGLSWSKTDRVSPYKLALAAKRLMNELASNLKDLAKRPKEV